MTPSSRRLLHYVGNVQRDNGVRVAKWFIANRPAGGKVAVIEGQAGVYAAAQRTEGFKSTIATRAASSRSSPAFPATGTGSSPMTTPRRSCSSIPI